MKKKIIIGLVILAGVILRVYRFDQLFYYGHDHDLAGWIIKDILFGKHIRLVGQETSNAGVFIGPLYYYLLTPFYLLTNLDPIGGIVLSTLIGVATIYSVYFVLGKIFTNQIGIIGSIIYTFSFSTVMTDREVVPTTPAMLWTVWFLYVVHLFLTGKQKRGWVFLGILVGLVLHINLALILTIPVALFAFLYSKTKINVKSIFVGIILGGVLVSPFVIFEVRHGFSQIKSITSSVTTDKSYIEGTSKGVVAKLDRVMQLVFKNTDTLFGGNTIGINQKLTFVVLIGILIWLVFAKKISKGLFVSIVLWQTLFITFFTLNSINLSEYYLNGMNIIWITIASVFLGYIYMTKYRIITPIFIFLFILLNCNRFFSIPINQSGYLQRKSIVSYIQEDAKAHGYKCISVSYITSPGNNLGYRYFFWRSGMHVNQPSSGSPVYSIVFPHSLVDRIDKSFGALGLIMPDYSRYTDEQVKQSCSGENSNVTDPMLGFTK